MRENDKCSQKVYNTDFEVLTRLVNEWDPIGLIRGGAPEDEYDCLVTKILSKLYSGIESHNLEDFLKVELNEHFGYSVSKSNKTLLIFCVKVYHWFNNERDKKNS